MFNVCYGCGEYGTDKEIDPTGPHAICPTCGYQHQFRLQPFFILTGASGVGKSTVCAALLGQLEEAVVLEGDMLLGLVPDKPTGLTHYWEHWLQLCSYISQSGKPVLLGDSAMGVPDNLASISEQRYFSAIHRLALVCDEDVLAERLRQRPAWRQSSHESFIQEHIRFNNWFKENRLNATPPFELIDTTYISVQESVEQVTQWVQRLVK